MIQISGICLLAFFCGSIPFAYILVRMLYGVNIRERGSGNPGASNVIREFGILPGLLTLILDASKGCVAIMLVSTLFPDLPNVGTAYLKIGLGVLAVLGHVYSPFLKGRGGKGIATLIGVFFILFPLGLVTGLFIGLMSMSIYRWFSLGSLLGILSLPIAYFTQTEQPLHPAQLPLLYLILSAVALTLLNHRDNIRRIFKGIEVEYRFKKE